MPLLPFALHEVKAMASYYICGVALVTAGAVRLVLILQGSAAQATSEKESYNHLIVSVLVILLTQIC